MAITLNPWTSKGQGEMAAREPFREIDGGVVDKEDYRPRRDP